MRKRIPVETRLLRKLVRSTVNSHDGTFCLEWTGARTSSGEYGKIRDEDDTLIGVHRLAYRLWVGEPGEDTDHLCENPPCCEPLHLEAVTHAENVRRASRGNARKTHCAAGHPYDEANTRVYRRGNKTLRICRACEAERAGVTTPRGPYRPRRRAHEIST